MNSFKAALPSPAVQPAAVIPYSDVPCPDLPGTFGHAG